MNYIEPFQKYLSPMGAIKTIANVLPGEIGESVEGAYDSIINGISNGIGWLLNRLMGTNGLLDSVGFYSLFTSKPEDMPQITVVGLENFLNAADLNNGMVKLLLSSFDDIDFSGIESHWTSSILVALSIFAMGTTILGPITQNAIVSLGAESLSMLLTIGSALAGNVVSTIVSFLFTYFNGIASIALSGGEPIIAGVSFAQMWCAILPATTL